VDEAFVSFGGSSSGELDRVGGVAPSLLISPPSFSHLSRALFFSVIRKMSSSMCPAEPAPLRPGVSAWEPVLTQRCQAAKRSKSKIVHCAFRLFTIRHRRIRVMCAKRMR